MKEAKITVKNLRVSFQTDDGRVQAVRGVDFEVFRGETLAIVGESGSGKSVTSKTIMGLLPPNAVVESGEIFFGGRDLILTDEKGYQKIRGDRISMIFQDPMSSLNPIMRIGEQLTEAMLLKVKARRKECRGKLEKYLTELKVSMEKAFNEEGSSLGDPEKLCNDFRQFAIKRKNEKKAGIKKESLVWQEEGEDLLSFIDGMEAGLRRSARLQAERIENSEGSIVKSREIFLKDNPVRAEWEREGCALGEKALQLLDPLAIKGDTVISPFPAGLMKQIKAYFGAEKKNRAGMKQYRKDKTRYDMIIASGKTHGLEAPRFIPIDQEQIRQNILVIIDNLLSHLKQLKLSADERDYNMEAIQTAGELTRLAEGEVETLTKAEAKKKALELMEEVGIPDPLERYRQYPFEFSGGMRQRIVIAIALAADPEILICDEPTTALDVTIQSQILELINRIKKERKLSVIFITHDLGVVANMADRVAVMYAGKIVEYGTAPEVFYQPAHPYTWALLSSMPDMDTKDKLEAIPGTTPNMLYPPKGDAFAGRNKYALEIDFEEMPPMFKITDTHYAATWLLHPDAPKVEMPGVIRERIERMKNRYGGTNQ